LGRNGRNIETIDLSLSEILQVYLIDNCICQLQLLVTNTAYLFRGAVKIIYYMWKIFHSELWNLAKWPVEFGGKICCGKLWSLAINDSQVVDFVRQCLNYCSVDRIANQKV